VLVLAWATADRVVVSIHDSGPGPSDPFVGLLPRPRQPLPDGQSAGGGRGLWITHQLCSHVSLLYDDGFTIRLIAGQLVAA
jgi:anti-sigma regulatory factor (Ser/Thr protein kinase)